MREIVSLVDNLPIAHIYRNADLLAMADGRTDLNPDQEPLQIAVIRTAEARAFKAHRHIHHPRTVNMTQESWYVVGGTVRVSLFDVDDSPIATGQPLVLGTGDLLVIHRGGHGYSNEAGACVIEFKVPQFEGVEGDKVLL